MPIIPPLADELRAAIALLREHRLYRAALRLEKHSANVLELKRKSKKKTTRRVGLVSGSGKIVKIKLAYDAEQIEEP